MAKLRRTKARQLNYKIRQICETNKQPVKIAYLRLNLNKKTNSKMHALVRSVAIAYECGCVSAAYVSIMYTLQIFLIGTNVKTLAVFSCLFICYFVVIFNQGGTKYRPFVSQLLYLTPQRLGKIFKGCINARQIFFRFLKMIIYIKNTYRKFQVHSSTTM